MSDSKQPPREEPTMPVGKRLAVFSVQQSAKGAVWVKAGSAWINRDGSLNVYLDALPLEGKLHIRESLSDAG